MAKAKDDQWLDLSTGGPILNSVVDSADYRTLKALALTDRYLYRKITARFRTEVAQIRTYFANHPMPAASLVNAYSDQQLLELIYHLNGGRSASADGIVIDVNVPQSQFDPHTERWFKDVNNFTITDDTEDGRDYVEAWTADGQYDRVDGPALTEINNYGREYQWFKHGQSHRLDGPAHIIWGAQFLQREVSANCTPLEKYWYKDGVLQHTDKTKFVDRGDDYSYCIREEQFYVNGELVDERRSKADYNCSFSEWGETDDSY